MLIYYWMTRAGNDTNKAMKMFIYCFYVLILFLCSYTIHILLTNTIQQQEVMKIKYHVWIVYENKSWQQQQVMKTKWNIWIVYGHKMAGKYLLAFGHIVSWKHEPAFFQFLVLSFNSDHCLLLIFFYFFFSPPVVVMQ